MKRIISVFFFLIFSVGIGLFIANNADSIFQDSTGIEQIKLDNGTIITIAENYSNVGEEIQKNGTLCVIGIELAEDGELIIPSVIDNMPVTHINADGLESSQDLRKLALPDTLIEIESFFPLCTNLEEIDIGRSMATVSYEIFMHCPNLEVINVSPDNERYLFQNGCLIERKTNCLMLGLSEFTIPENIECIGDYAFLGRIQAKELVLPEGIKSIGSGAFNNCDIKEIGIPDSVETIGEGAFAFSGITKIVLPSKLQKIASDLFWSCDALEIVEIGEGVEIIEENAFAWCSNLSTIIVDLNNKTYYSDQNCLIEKGTDRLILCGKDATLSERIQVIGTGALSESCTLGEQLSIFIPNGVSEMETLSLCGYDGSLTAVYIPLNVEKIADRAIILTGAECKTLTVYCEAVSKPEAWDDNWLGNTDNTEVVWGAEMPNWQ